MTDLYSFISLMAQGIVKFLLTAPIYYFTGCLILICVAVLVRRIIR